MAKKKDTILDVLSVFGEKSQDSDNIASLTQSLNSMVLNSFVKLIQTGGVTDDDFGNILRNTSANVGADLGGGYGLDLGVNTPFPMGEGVRDDYRVKFTKKFQEGGRVTSDLRGWFKNEYGANDEQLNSLFNQIGKVESNNKNVTQTGGGPGRGFFQFETETGGGSGAFQVALNRYENLNKSKIDVNWKAPDWFNKARISDNAMDLTREQQEDLLLADFAMKSGSDDLIRDSLKTGSAKELWLKKHWAGAEEGTEEYKKKGKQWR